MSQATASKSDPGGSGRRALIAALTVAVACTLALAGCQALGQGFDRVEFGTPAADRLNDGLARFADRGPKRATVRLERFTRFEWDRVYAFVGYQADVAEINATVGAQVYSSDGYLDEGTLLLVFMSGEEIVRAALVAKTQVLSPERPLFSRDAAVLRAFPVRGDDSFLLRFVGRGRAGEGG